jgi:hypothetical protein
MPSSRLAQLPAFNPAGGVGYHLRARRHSRRLWEPFRWSLGEWLLGWQPPEVSLVLVGPSAGYNLQPFLFERFEHVLVLEPDPIARWLFRRRLARAPLDPRPRLEFVSEDHLVQHPERLVPLLERAGEPALLFCNVLGQLTTLLDADEPDARFEAIRQAVRAASAGRSYASFHDRLSGPLAPDIDGVVRSARRWSDAEALEHAYAAPAGEAPVVELTDHQTEGFFPEDQPHVYLRWELEPGAHHLIEAVCTERTQGVSGAAGCSPAPAGNTPPGAAISGRVSLPP